MLRKFSDYVMNKGLSLLLFSLFSSAGLLAQQKVMLTGTVLSPDHLPLSGVSVNIKGATKGTVTDAGGKFTLQADPSARLIFSFIGYSEIEIPARDIVPPFVVQMRTDSSSLGEVTVTALGIKRKSAALTYSVQKVTGDEVTRVPQTNFMNSLTGKVSGMTVSTSSGLGSSVKVLLRGSRSVSGSNQPLYVVDGIPLQNPVQTVQNGSQSSQDFGDGISNINPDDIESVSVLKGASAAALYGSQAANGVILITTKKGKAGAARVNFSSNMTLDKAAYKPELQNSYGQTAAGSDQSWGGPITNARDNVADFFKTGHTWVNSIGVTSGTDKMMTYFSYANTSAKGIVANNNMTKHNISLRESLKFFNDKLTVNGGVSVTNQIINNNPNAGFQTNPLLALYNFPRGLDITPYKNNYQVFDSARNLGTQNWFVTPAALNQNPYWLLNRNLYAYKRNRILLNLGLRYDITPWLNFQLRGNADDIIDDNTTKLYAGTTPVYGGQNGAYDVTNLTTTQYYGDAILNMNRSFGDLGINATVGSSITSNSQNGQRASSSDLFIPNVFNLQNMNKGPLSNFGSYSEGTQQLQALFESINLSWKKWLYLDLTGRTDWSSNLSYTSNGSYFYPSGGLTLVLSELMTLPQAISFAKVRGSYAIVGNTVPPYVTNPVNYVSNGQIVFNTTAPFGELKPEKSKSLELGLELRMFKDQLSFDVTYYKTNAINQFFSIAVPPGTGYSSRFINGGNIRNTGVEATVGYTQKASHQLRWTTQANFDLNRNKVISLAAGIDQYVLMQDINNYSNILKVGGSYGDLYGQVVKRDSATHKVIINADGTPAIQSGQALVGNASPKFKLGWNNTFDLKEFSLSFLIDGSFGGHVMSLTQQVLDGFGVSKASGDARANGGVKVNGIDAVTGKDVDVVDARKWYTTVGNIQHATGEYMYSATTVRLRQVSFGYSLPKKLIANSVIRNIQLSLIARNLWYIRRDAPFDPEMSLSTGNQWPGLDVGGLPATRSYGLSLNVTF
jgi:TonB-linked SusC/RagA family outer membrane protein